MRNRETEKQRNRESEARNFVSASPRFYVSAGGFTLVELVITITVLAVLALGTIPIVQNAVRRQKEQRLRETLREIRLAIDEFHRDALGNPRCGANIAGGQQAPAPDPRSLVMISDCKIFETENLDRYPPTLEILVEGVEVTPRGGGIGTQTRSGSVFDDPNGATRGNATEPKKKVYLREMPVDPFTGKPLSCESGVLKCRSPYQEKDAGDWDGISIFDVRYDVEGETLDGVKYKDL